MITILDIAVEEEFHYLGMDFEGYKEVFLQNMENAMMKAEPSGVLKYKGNAFEITTDNSIYDLIFEDDVTDNNKLINLKYTGVFPTIGLQQILYIMGGEYDILKDVYVEKILDSIPKPHSQNLLVPAD